MKKISMIALTFVLTAGLLTACRAPSMDETTAPSTQATTSTSSTRPTTQPTTAATVPPTIPASTGPSDATEGTGGINTMDPTESMPGKHRGAMPRR